jgi:D-xylose transport system permease protein
MTDSTASVPNIRSDPRTAGGRPGPFAWINTGPIPVLIGVVLIWLYFYSQNASYISARNISNLTVQMAVIAILALGSAIVMIAGQVDLSIGSTMGLCAALLAVLLRSGLPVWLALIVTIATGLALGLVQAVIVALFGLPAFLVTLGGFLAYTGIQVQVVGSAGEVQVSNPFVLGIANDYLPPWLTWLLLAVAIVIGVIIEWRRRQEWHAAGFTPVPLWRSVLRIIVPYGAIAAAVAYFNSYLGFSYAGLLVLLLVVIFGWITQRTLAGRDLYAVGGNQEAARRAGISVNRVTVTAITLNGGLAAVAGIVSASTLFSASGSTGGGNLLLEAIAAAVIGGVSLFGGRGRMYMALIGALVITSISNGLALMGLSAAASYEATGGILVVAICIDSYSRRRQGRGRLAKERQAA